MACVCLRFFVQSRGHGTDFLACQSTRVTTDFPELIQTLRHHLTDLLAHIECNGILFLINTIILFDETLKLIILQIYFLNSFLMQYHGILHLSMICKQETMESSAFANEIMKLKMYQ